MNRVGRTNQCRNAEARIETRARRAEDRAHEIIFETRARYHYTRPNVNGGRAGGPRPGGSVRLNLESGDVSQLGRIWGKTFDLVTGVVQNMPLSISWEVDTTDLGDEDSWLQGAVSAVVYTVAHEMGLSVTETEK